MRDIKFRTWNIADKTMGEPFSLQTAIASRVYNGVDTTGVEYMQFTGIRDQNGKDIYEGDILKIEYLDGPKTGSVEQEEGWYGIQVQEEPSRHPAHFSPFTSTDDPVVLGNIYENPELLS